MKKEKHGFCDGTLTIINILASVVNTIVALWVTYGDATDIIMVTMMA